MKHSIELFERFYSGLLYKRLMVLSHLLFCIFILRKLLIEEFCLVLAFACNNIVTEGLSGCFGHEERDQGPTYTNNSESEKWDGRPT